MSAEGLRPRGNRLFLKKSVSQIQKEAAKSELKRSLGPINLMSLGIGAIIGAGIFVLTGQVAAAHAGPAIMLSFVVAGIACGLAGLCYAELASTMPVSGSAYTYAYGTLGEIFAWIMGWLLVLEYGVAASTVAVGWSGYVVSILNDFGLADSLFPTIQYAGGEGPSWATPLIQAVTSDGGIASFPLTGTFNLVAAIGIAAVCSLLVLGVSESASINNVIVMIKIIVLLTFIAVGIQYINPANWQPFIPENTTGKFGEYGATGILRGASIIFFAYVGFEAVSTAAAEAKNPSKDVPVGILGALIVCTLIYMAVAAVMTGVVPYLELASPAPVAVAIDRMGLEWANIAVASAEGGQLNLISFLIKIGAITGLSSVMLVLCYGQTRIFYTMARDGLLPRVFAIIHPKFRTPWIGTILLGVVIAIAASFLPISILGDLVSLGTAVAFSIVCLSVIFLRIKHPEMERPFRVPGGIFTAVLGILSCLALAGFNFWPMIQHAMDGNPLPLMILGGYAAVGAVVYIIYGFWNSKLAKGIDITEDLTMSSPAAALGGDVDNKHD
ncbi:MAG: amino acid permease [Alphaproteobacteria bacterium]|uniref:amino acid permease n=2 Tax=Brevundimonas sp. TaxID=1871086 RepID=UPI0012243732|nr:amino acid permease [Brevundimonas sp.]MBU3969691.1 amino acid permease [Alphaproteobacteria bacterium]MBA3050141.1 amino acid permease [Brevundimonas sp.]MBU3973664.1 amino acid permease [Alphaproteobacteria bacterium]MBU4038554.1 amino acid permease [Alphaproteobacteria bacterium]TAJ63802.1 MAG: amino acid permease [Brevundimonas sp.]